MNPNSKLAKFSPVQIGCGAALFTALIGVVLVAAISLFAVSIPVFQQLGGAVETISNIAGYGAIAVGIIAYFWAKNRKM